MSRSFDELHDSTPEELERLADAGCRLAGLMSRHQREKTAAAKPRLTVAVDLDGVLARYEPDDPFDILKIGEPVRGAVDFVRKLLAFANVIVTSARVSYAKRGDDVADAIGVWLNYHHFPLVRVAVWRGRGKPLAAAYVDDRAVVCRPQTKESPETAFFAACDLCRALCQNISDGEREEHGRRQERC